jgi:hypothetical protein
MEPTFFGRSLKVVNATSVDVTLQIGDGEVTTYKASGTPIIMKQRTRLFPWMILGAPAVYSEYTEIEPFNEEVLAGATHVFVPMPVGEHLMRLGPLVPLVWKDKVVIGPDSAPAHVKRDAKGQIVSCDRWRIYYAPGYQPWADE